MMFGLEIRPNMFFSNFFSKKPKTGWVTISKTRFEQTYKDCTVILAYSIMIKEDVELNESTLFPLR